MLLLKLYESSCESSLRENMSGSDFDDLWWHNLGKSNVDAKANAIRDNSAITFLQNTGSCHGCEPMEASVRRSRMRSSFVCHRNLKRKYISKHMTLTLEDVERIKTIRMPACWGLRYNARSAEIAWLVEGERDASGQGAPLRPGQQRVREVVFTEANETSASLLSDRLRSQRSRMAEYCA